MTFNNFILNKLSKISGFLTLMVLLSLSREVSAQKTIFLEVSDAFNGELLKVEWRVESQKTGRSYVIKTEDDRQFFEINTDDEVQVKAIKDFYYIQDIPVKEVDLYDGQEIKVAMQKRPTASLKLLAHGKETEKNEPASFELFFEGRMIGRGNTTRNVTVYDLILNQAGTYEIVTKAAGYAENREHVDVQISTPSKQIEKIILLEKMAKEIAVRFVNEQTGDPVDAMVSITETSSGKVVYHQQVSNGVVLFTFNNGSNYSINAVAANYKEYSKSIDGSQREDLRAVMRPYTFIEFKITDSRTSKAIPAKVKLTSPSGAVKSFAYQAGERIQPEETGEFKIEVQSEGYVSTSGTMSVSSLYGSSVVPTFGLVEADKQFYIEVIDRYSKKPVADADFRVFGPGGQKLGGIQKNEKGQWYFITDPSKKYFIEVNGKGYQDFTKSLSEDNKRFSVELDWKPEVTHIFKLLEQATDVPVLNANLKILNNLGEELFLIDTKKDGVFLTKMDERINVNYSVSAEGFKPEVIPGETSANNLHKLYLSRLNSDTYVVKAFDFLTAEALAANLKYFLNKNEIDVIKDLKTKTASVYFSNVGEYSLEALLPDYKPLHLVVKPSSIKNGLIELRLKKEFYTVKFKIEDLNTNAELRDLQFRILAENKTRVPEKFVPSDKLYTANLDGEMRYALEIVKNGYETFSESFYVKDLVKSSFTKSVTLKRIPPPVVVEEVKPLVVQKIPEVVQPKTEPRKEVPRVVKEAEVMPKSSVQMASEFSKAEAIGKRYLLDEVYFDQGSSAIRNSEVEQLNELAKSLKENKRLVIEIVGYTDNVGDPRLNLGLSQFRAKAVSNYLFNRGADPDRIRSNGFGQESAVASNETEENRSKNRRVEMVLIEN